MFNFSLNKLARLKNPVRRSDSQFYILMGCSKNKSAQGSCSPYSERISGHIKIPLVSNLPFKLAIPEQKIINLFSPA